jgi:hypothetical protein
VRVPKANVVGQINRGWDVAKYLLEHERAMISGMGERSIGRPLGQIAADSIGTDAQGRLGDPILRSQSRTSTSTKRRLPPLPSGPSILPRPDRLIPPSPQP